ncbi:hypothetical protein [Mesorhizobium sp. 128a]
MTGGGAAGPEKLRVGRVVSKTVGVIGRNVILSLAVSGVFFVLPLVLVDLWTFWYWPGLAYLAQAYGNSAWAIVLNMGSAMVSGFLGIAVNFLGLAMLSRAAIDDINGNRRSIGGCIRAALRHFLPIMGIGLVIYLVFFVARYVMFAAGLFIAYGGLAAFVVLTVPCVMWGLGISVAFPVAVQERLGIDASMLRSRTLTRGYRWPIFGLASIGFGLIVALRLGLFFGTGFAPVAIASSSDAITGAIPRSLVSAIVWLVTSIAVAVTYVELRRIKEGTSVEDLAEIFS